MHDLERKQLGWQRRDDWGSHPQLAHQLEVNRFVTDLIEATLADPVLGVSEWWPPAEAADHLSGKRRGRVLPDAGFHLETPAGPIECYLEWDRATETQERLAEKLLAYRLAEARLYSDGSEPRCILFVVPGSRRLETLRRAFGHFERERKRRSSQRSFRGLGGRWPLLAGTMIRLRTQGPLAVVWERLDLETAGRLLALTDLPVRGDLRPIGLSGTLGRRWRKDDPDFWRRLSPLGAGRLRETDNESGEADLEEPRRDAAVFRSANPDQDLHSSAINGSMNDCEDDVEEERWR